ncbi:PilZ domain-containing protein [Cohnella caldifontis]|uniref:PilZ domain-containing protein n=1 Tax=Cohnella caldifontis TaxID=3027471 RepID=UPI0023EDCC57|nr:PilZ domain-containing protein [Cohnella sp. YIM B05605]
MSQGTSTPSDFRNSNGDLLPLGILLHCRTVVESQNFVTTGLMTHVEGELFEVEISEYDAFELGEKVKLTVYTPAGIQSFPSNVFAKYEGAIALIQPPEMHKRFHEKREHPRVEVKGSLRIMDIVDKDGQSKTLEEPLEVPLKNISVSGLGFQVPDMPELFRSAKLKASVALGFEFSCELEIVRREKQEDGVECGAVMRVLEPEMMRPLRALILRQQVERNVQTRKQGDRDLQKKSGYKKAR